VKGGGRLILLRDYRKSAGLSQKELADKSGVSQQMISMIENGERKNPGIDTMFRLANALHCGVHDIYVPEDRERA
jgi:transcriptional regulator with XRE-family HTH domain